MRRWVRRRNRMIAGVASGMAAYFNMDVTLSRVIWVAAAIFADGFPVVLLYILLCFILPQEEAQDREDPANTPKNNTSPQTWQWVAATLLILIGLSLLLDQLLHIHVRSYILPAILLVLGVVLFRQAWLDGKKRRM